MVRQEGQGHPSLSSVQTQGFGLALGEGLKVHGQALGYKKVSRCWVRPFLHHSELWIRYNRRILWKRKNQEAEASRPRSQSGVQTRTKLALTQNHRRQILNSFLRCQVWCINSIDMVKLEPSIHKQKTWMSLKQTVLIFHFARYELNRKKQHFSINICYQQIIH